MLDLQASVGMTLRLIRSGPGRRKGHQFHRSQINPRGPAASGAYSPCKAGTVRQDRTETKEPHMRVFVEAHYRVRNGRIQHVRSHWRKWPERRSATVIAFAHPSLA
jgi:hypothetical protein